MGTAGAWAGTFARSRRALSPVSQIRFENKRKEEEKKMPITQVGYQLTDPGSLAIFALARNDSGVLDSLQKAVLASANDVNDMPGGRLPCPRDGARWNVPSTPPNAATFTGTTPGSGRIR